MPTFDLYLRNGHIVTEDEVFHGGVLVHDGTIAQLVRGNPDHQAHKVVNASGRHVLPGVVDPHVHFNAPGRDHWEGFVTGTMAAAAGGVTTVVEMPLNATPPTITADNFEQKKAIAQREALVDYALWGGLVNDNLSELSSLHKAGAVGFKAFLSNSSVDFERIDDDLVYAGLLATKNLNTFIGFHAENEFVTRHLMQQMQKQGRVDRASWQQSRPSYTELEAIKRVCFWVGVTKGNGYVVHVSIPEGLQQIATAKAEGLNINAEVTPHHLFFTDDDFQRLGPVAKCAPPLRPGPTVEQMWECVLSGMVDTIGSDHSPCPWEDKAAGIQDIWKAWGGITGIQTLLPVMLSEGVNRRNMSLSLLVRLVSSNPAKRFGLYPRKGAIQVGSEADLTVVDLDKEWALKPEHLFSKNPHSPYVDYSFRGCVEETYVRGHNVYADGQVTGSQGLGQLLTR